MQSSEQIDQLATALAAAQGETEHASKDRTNPAFKSRYADLASVLDACREPLSRHGIAIMQAPSVDGSTVSVETRLVHKSGQWVSTTISAQVPDGKPTTIGSAVTYLRRYGLAAMAGVAPADDDDGAQASRPQVARLSGPRPEDLAVADAVERVSAKFPHLAEQARHIGETQTLGPSHKLAALRELYKSQPQQETP